VLAGECVAQDATGLCELVHLGLIASWVKGSVCQQTTAMKAAKMTTDIEEDTKAVHEEKRSPEDKLPKVGALQEDELELATGGVRSNGPIMN
jgi:hypothetical protein